MANEALKTAFDTLHRRSRERLDEAALAKVDRVLATEPTRGRTYGFEDVGAEAKDALIGLSECAAPAEAGRCLISGLAARNFDTLNKRLTPRVRERTLDNFERLRAFLEQGELDEYHYPGDFFLKDYRFVTGMTVPCGAQEVDLAERPGPKTILSLVSKAPVLAFESLFLPWFRPHTESRYLDEFNPEGWDRCYAEIADLLAIFPKVRGMIATSWFYDPALTEISPRLAYLRSVPTDNGAIEICHGTTQFDIDSATKTSGTRRKLYEDGKYVPRCWSILWKRNDMIDWAKRYRAR